ncbi:MAG: BatD family protein [Proteobacteria bacterium]|nr:BatD family protein [Pseudomonadota bacterium]MBU4294581.1 BatD family protein [Pseudomonadota bacterium]MCG2747117.1 BatD family protein [Desulfobulbaceae bacterium]
MKNYPKKTSQAFLLTFILLSLQLFCATILFAAADISVETVLDRQEASIGEPLSMQIQVNGADSAQPPDLSQLVDFTVQERGGQGNSSTSVTNINGKWERITRHAYFFNYTITPKRAGRLTIPALAVEVEGSTYDTEPVTITVTEPAETDDLKLRIFLSPGKCYVGEPVTMTVTWFVGQDVNGFEFQLPVVDDPRFSAVPLNSKTGGSSQDEIKIPIGSEAVVATKGRGEFAGRDFLTVTFQYLLLPKEAGSFTLPQATVACQTVSGFRQSPRRAPFKGFGNFDDFFGNSSQPVYRTQVVPSNTPELTVLPLPEQDKPADFSGLVGNYSIQSDAAPQNVNIGDPVTLTVTVSGPYARQATLPDLSRFLPASSFKIPEEIAADDMEDNRKIFTQTIRVKDTSVTAIPPIALSYFDPAKKNYQLASTAPIPLTVHAARVVTATDAEGKTATVGQKELKAAEKGLAPNYAGDDALIDQRAESYRPGWWLLLFAAPPLLFFLIGLVRFMKSRKENGREKRQARHALATLERQLASPALSAENLSFALKEYLAVKLDKKAGALTFHDVEPALAALRVDAALVLEVRELLTRFETWQYAGQNGTAPDIEQFRARTLAAARSLEAYFP